MANAIYDEARYGFANAEIDWDTDTIKVILIDTADYTFSQTHDYLNDVAGAARVATATLASKTNTGGILDAADVTFTSVTGDQSEALIIYKDTGVESTSRLILYIDTVSSGFPVTPNGGDIQVQWDNSTNKIFKL